MALEHQGTSDPKKPNRSNDYLKYSGLAVQLIVVIGVFGWLGHLVDQFLNFQFPVFLLSFVLLSFAGMIYQLYRSINKFWGVENVFDCPYLYCANIGGRWNLLEWVASNSVFPKSLVALYKYRGAFLLLTKNPYFTSGFFHSILPANNCAEDSCVWSISWHSNLE